MGQKKLSTTVYITPEQNLALKLLNQKTKVPIAEYIREGIDLALEKHKSLLPGQMSLLPAEPNLLEERGAVSGSAPSVSRGNSVN